MFAKIRFFKTYFLEANPLVSKHLCGGVQRQCPVTPVRNRLLTKGLASGRAVCQLVEQLIARGLAFGF